MISNTISWLEVVYTIVALVGLVFNALVFSRSVGDYYYVLDKKVNGLRKYSALTSIIIFLGGTIIQFSFVVVGCVAMTQPSAHLKINWSNYVIAGTFIGTSIISAVFASLIYTRRIRIVEMIETQLALDDEKQKKRVG